MPVDVSVPGNGQEGVEMAEPLAEVGNLQIAFTAMANALSNASGLANLGFSASADRRTSRADQLSGDAQAMWTIAMTSPSVSSAMGYRTAVESGAGRTRLEANRPSETSAAAPSGP